MGEIEVKELTLNELQSKVYALKEEIKNKEHEIEDLNCRINRYSILNIADGLTAHKSYNDTMCTMLLKKGGTNVCKLYGTVHYKIEDTSLFAKQITLIPKLLKIASKIVDGEYSYNLRKEAEDLLYEASLESIDWVDVSNGKRMGDRYVLSSKKKEVEA